MNFLVMPLFFLSGALFPLEGLPIALTILTRIDPLSYGIDALRILFIGMGHYGLFIDIVILSVVTLVFLFLGSYFFRKIQV